MKHKFYTRKHMVWKYSFAVLAIITGMFLNYFNLGREFFAYESVGNYLIWVGFLMLVITTIFYLVKREKVIDERMEKIGYKAFRVTFSAIILGAFILMLWDGIQKITLSYQLFMSYLICFILIIYIIAYKLIERKS